MGEFKMKVFIDTFYNVAQHDAWDEVHRESLYQTVLVENIKLVLSNTT